jgi:hypothetical protein
MTTALSWVHPPETFGEFRPFEPLHAETPQGVYSVVRCGYKFDAWFLSREGAMTFLGTYRTAMQARRCCELREGRRHDVR